MFMACSNATQYIQHIFSNLLPSPLSTAPKFTQASLTVYSILQSKLKDFETMPPPIFSEFLQQAYDDCMQTDASLLLYEVYILFLFTQILREIMCHLAIQENSQYHDILDEKQSHIITTVRRYAAPLSLNFKFNETLPHSDNWAPISTPSRTRAWIMWPDIANEEAKQYNEKGKTHWREIPQNFEENDFLGGQTKATQSTKTHFRESTLEAVKMSFN